MLGSRPKAGLDPMPATEAGELKRIKEESRDSFARARECEDAEEARELLRESRRKGKEHRALLRKATDKQWQTVADTLEEGRQVGR